MELFAVRQIWMSLMMRCLRKGSSFSGRAINGKDVQAMIPFTDQASIENAIICWASLLALGYEPEEADKTA
jgi:hypothetical protein